MMMKMNVCLTSGIHPMSLFDDEDECMLNIGHTSNVMMMMKMNGGSGGLECHQ